MILNFNCSMAIMTFAPSLLAGEGRNSVRGGLSPSARISGEGCVSKIMLYEGI